MPTLRRLNDGERYYGLTWRGWLAAILAGGALYGAVKLSPFGLQPTVTFAVLALAFAWTIVYALTGQAISPGRYLLALVAFRRSPKRYGVPELPDKHGLVLDAAPRRGVGDESPSQPLQPHDTPLSGVSDA